MKQKDIAMIVVVTIVSGVISLLVSNFLFGGSKHRNIQAEVVQPITDQFTTPDSKYFNGNSINPTRLISIGDNSNPAPFAPTKQ